MIITVHDELVFDVPRTSLEPLVAIVRDQMEKAMSLTVPIKVSIKAGLNWLDMEKI